MQVKLILSWNIKQGRDQEYFEFVVREFVPGMTKLGLQPTEAWFTTYGKSPQIMMGGLAPDLPKMKAAIGSKEWKELQEKLDQYITDYKQKIIWATPYFPV